MLKKVLSTRLQDSPAPFSSHYSLRTMGGEIGGCVTYMVYALVYRKGVLNSVRNESLTIWDREMYCWYVYVEWGFGR